MAIAAVSSSVLRGAHFSCSRFTLRRLYHVSSVILKEQDSQLNLYNSLSESVQPIIGAESKGLAWYTCGPTTYAPAHLGHARTYLTIDIMRRVLQHLAPTAQQQQPPLFILNITNVDDKILTAARETKEDPLVLAHRFEQAFWDDMDALHCLRPHVVTRVSDYVESDIVPYIAKLEEQGVTYEVPDDGIYFSIQAFEENMGHLTRYGKLAPPAAAEPTFFISLAASETNAGPANKKRDARDFCLWKSREATEEELAWDSPWGAGRPGWHIECSAMIHAIQEKFKETHVLAVHAGGVDLKFPHHANEIAQAEAHTNKGDWIPHWVHTGHLYIDGLKMSKSLKNFVTIRELLDNTSENASILSSPADDLRLWCLGIAGSYRSPATYSEASIAQARAMRERWVQFLIAASPGKLDPCPRQWTDDAVTFYQQVMLSSALARNALTSDLDGTVFCKEVTKLVDGGGAYLRRTDSVIDAPLQHCVQEVRELLTLVGFSDKTAQAGLMLSSAQPSGNDDLIDEFVNFRTAIRRAALKSDQTKVLQLCDEARDTIFPTLGLELMDGDKGEWRYCLPRDKDIVIKDEEAPKPGIITALLDIPLCDLFKVGPYQGQFSEYDDNDMPVTNADGTPVSSRLYKKLLKKQEKHWNRLAAAAAKKS